MGNKDQLTEKIKSILDRAIEDCEGDLDFLVYSLQEVIEEIVVAVNEHEG